MREVEPIIRKIAAAETLPLRHAILRTGLPRETAVFPGDDAESSRHFGAFVGRQLVGVATIHHVPPPDHPEHEGSAYQLRGMATAEKFRGQGIGGVLLGACIAAAQHTGASWLWCNARTPAAEFYARHGFAVQGGVFDIPTAGPHYRMLRPL
jgi:GNAT superfamily N-acetyltransferase